jgi:nucleoside-diphosphate-sugar epimerase
VYDARKIPLDEDSTREPVNLYALAHLGREMVLSNELQRLQIPLCVFRLTSIYGPGDTHNAYGPNRFVRSALSEGRIELFGQGEERRSHVFINDAVRLIGLALERRSSGTLNVAVRHAASFKEVADLVARLAGGPARIDYLPRTVPVMHRTFVNSAVFAAFPDFEFTTLDVGLSALISASRTEPIGRAASSTAQQQTDRAGC